MSKVAVTVFDVYEIKTALPGQPRRFYKVFDEIVNFGIAYRRQFPGYIEKGVQVGMMVGDNRPRRP